jgi:dipeptidyl aminopeptidase/acylaminoacyl peptidase
VSEEERTFDLDSFLDLPRLSGLAVSPDGSRVVTSIGERAPDGKRYRTALWEVDPAGQRPARRLTRSAPGESSPAFLPSGELLFTSSRPDPDIEDGEGDEDRARLWLLPADGGEARLVADPPAGVGSYVVARDHATVVLQVEAHEGCESWEEDEKREEAREEAGVSGRLYTSYPVRYWDRWLGPRQPRLWVAEVPDDERITSPRLLTPDAGMALLNAGYDVSPDGRVVVTGWQRTEGPLLERAFDLVAIDVETGERRTLADDGGWYAHWGGVAFSPDGSRLAVLRWEVGTPERPLDVDLVLIDLASGERAVLTGDTELWPGDPAWTPDGDAIVFHADERGHGPLFRLDVATREVTRLTAAHFHSDHVIPTSGGAEAFALRSAIDRAPHPVRVSISEAGQQPTELSWPDTDVRGPGRVERVTATADDGAEIPSWLVLPPGDGPHPLVVFIHGGPLGSWNAWHWRWNPHLLAVDGYAVLLPDPALSTGYGRDFIARGWGRWGHEPYTDLMAAVEGAAARGDIDDERIAAMGGSFGGYMANWVAGQTDRFRCIVTHASLWDQRQMHGTSDIGVWFDEQEFGDPYADPTPYEEVSPYRHVGNITTPMLVIHGEKDHRVPIGEGVRLWTDLMRHGVEARFLYFPDENHWVLRPPNVRAWYETVLAFLGEHLRDEPFERPEHL